MENPRDEIIGVVTRITAAASPDAQKYAMLTYFTQDVGFKHPLCTVRPGPNSRLKLMGVYQWYRTMSPKIEPHVDDMIYDEALNIVVLKVTQKFRIRFSIFPAAPASLIVRLTLREINGKHYIAFQEDFYHPQDLVKLMVPPLAPIITLMHFFATWGSVLGAWILGGVLGLWNPHGGLWSDSSSSAASTSAEDQDEIELESMSGVSRSPTVTNASDRDKDYIELHDQPGTKVWSSTAATDPKAEKGLDLQAPGANKARRRKISNNHK